MSYKHQKEWRLRHTKQRNAQRARYYLKHSIAFKGYIRWNQPECSMILDPSYSDVVLHLILGRSIQAIQSKRCALIKEVKPCQELLNKDGLLKDVGATEAVSQEQQPG